MQIRGGLQVGDETENSKGSWWVQRRVQVVMGSRRGAGNAFGSRHTPWALIARPGRWCGADSKIRPVKQTSFLPNAVTC